MSACAVIHIHVCIYVYIYKIIYLCIHKLCIIIAQRPYSCILSRAQIQLPSHQLSLAAATMQPCSNHAAATSHLSLCRSTSGNFVVKEWRQIVKLITKLVEGPVTMDYVDRLEWFQLDCICSGLRQDYVQYIRAGLALLVPPLPHGKNKDKGSFFCLEDMQQLCRLIAELVVVPDSKLSLDSRMQWSEELAEGSWPGGYSRMRGEYIQYIRAGLSLLAQGDRKGKGKGKGQGKGNHKGKRDGPYIRPEPLPDFSCMFCCYFGVRGMFSSMVFKHWSHWGTISGLRSNRVPGRVFKGFI